MFQYRHPFDQAGYIFIIPIAYDTPQKNTTICAATFYTLRHPTNSHTFLQIFTITKGTA